MQTFLPYPNFEDTMKVLDINRLKNQRYEADYILRQLWGEHEGYKNHPAVNMWRGYENALILYYNYAVRETNERMTFRLNDFTFRKIKGKTELPWWLGNDLFHKSHQSNLIRKKPNWYRKRFSKNISDNWLYIWPREDKTWYSVVPDWAKEREYFDPITAMQI